MRTPTSCNVDELKKGPWSEDEDEKLKDCINKNGYDNWRLVPKLAGLNRDGKSCRLRWKNYLSPDIKRGNISSEEEDKIITLQSLHGNKWARIASELPGRTDNEIKNFWNTHIRKRFLKKGIDPEARMPILTGLNLPYQVPTPSQLLMTNLILSKTLHDQIQAIATAGQMVNMPLQTANPKTLPQLIDHNANNIDHISGYYKELSNVGANSFQLADQVPNQTTYPDHQNLFQETDYEFEAINNPLFPSYEDGLLDHNSCFDGACYDMNRLSQSVPDLATNLSNYCTGSSTINADIFEAWKTLIEDDKIGRNEMIKN